MTTDATAFDILRARLPHAGFIGSHLVEHLLRRHALADLGKARRLLGYAPSCSLREGLERTADRYARGGGR